MRQSCGSCEQPAGSTGNHHSAVASTTTACSYVGNQASNVLHQLLATYEALWSKLQDQEGGKATGQPVDYRDELADLSDALHRLKRVLADVISHQRLVGGRVRLRLRPCVLRTHMQAFAERMTTLHHSVVAVDIDARCPPVVYIDAFRVEQVLANAVANAIQAIARVQRSRSPTPVASTDRPDVVIAVRLVASPKPGPAEIVGAEGVITSADYLLTLLRYSDQLLGSYARRASGSRPTDSMAPTSVATASGAMSSGGSFTSRLVPLRRSQTQQQVVALPPAAGGGLSIRIPSLDRERGTGTRGPRAPSGSIPPPSLNSAASAASTETLPLVPEGWDWWILFDVINSGSLRGLEPLHLFMPFEMQAYGSAAAARHTGLGLPIARLLASMMGARVGLFESDMHPAELLNRTLPSPVAHRSLHTGNCWTHFVMQVPCIAATGLTPMITRSSTQSSEGAVGHLAVDEEERLMAWRIGLQGSGRGATVEAPSSPPPPPPPPPQPYPPSPPAAARVTGAATATAVRLVHPRVALATRPAGEEPTVIVPAAPAPAAAASATATTTAATPARAVPTAPPFPSLSILPAAAALPPASMTIAAGAASGDVPDRSAKTVLIVDDSAANRKVNAKLVRRLGFVPEVAADGDEVLPLMMEAARHDRPYAGEARSGGREPQSARTTRPRTLATAHLALRCSHPAGHRHGAHERRGHVPRPARAWLHGRPHHRSHWQRLRGRHGALPGGGVHGHHRQAVQRAPAGGGVAAVRRDMTALHW